MAVYDMGSQSIFLFQNYDLMWPLTYQPLPNPSTYGMHYD